MLIKNKNIMLKFIEKNHGRIEYSNIITNTKNILYNPTNDKITFNCLIEINYKIEITQNHDNNLFELFKHEKQILKTKILTSSFASMITTLHIKYNRQNYLVEFGTKAIANFFEKRLAFSTKVALSIPLIYPKLTELDLNDIMPFSLLEDGDMTNVMIYLSFDSFIDFMRFDKENYKYHDLHRLVNKKIIEENINEFRKHEKYVLWKTNMDNGTYSGIEVIKQQESLYLSRIDMTLLLTCLILMFYAVSFGIYTRIEYNREILRKRE